MIYAQKYQFIIAIFKSFNPVQDEHFRGRSRMGRRGKKVPLPKICHTYPAKMKLGTVIPYLKKIQKIYESRQTALCVLLTSAFYYRKSENFAISRNTAYWYIISNSSNLFWAFRDYFNKHGCNFGDVNKNGNSRPS